ncbi:MAG: hypothetical protein AAGB12_05340 [Pseudomonadota bacterium]
MNVIKVYIAFLILTFCFTTDSAEYSIDNLTISKIRAVGNYSVDTYDEIVELWFTTPLNWPNQSQCTNTSRVIVDAKFNHILSAAYLAFSSSKKVKVNIDTALPNRFGTCEVSYLDVYN